jgi:hypothetical protein
LAGPVSGEALGRLRRMLIDLSDRFVEERPGYFDLNVVAERLGAVDGGGLGPSRPFLVVVAGPGVGDEASFEAEHADMPDLEPLIGFAPTHDVSVIAMCNGDVDHVVTALLTAEVMEIVGGVASVEIHDRHVPVVAELPGLVAMMSESGHCAFGTSELVRAWAAHPDFRLVK